MRVVQNSNNIIRVLKLIYSNPGISRIEISKKLLLNRSTITVVVNRLTELNIIEEIVESKSINKRGRARIGLKICEKTGILLGIEMRTDSFVAVLVSLNGTVIETINKKAEETKCFFEYFKNIYNSILKDIEKTNQPLLGICVALSGIINTHKGIIRGSNPLGVSETENFYDEIKSFIDVPLFIENDANCGCWGELSNIENTSSQDFIFVLGEFRKARFSGDNTHLLAIGLGIVIDNKVHYGKDYSAGEYQSPQYVMGNKTQFSITDEEFSLIDSDIELINKIKEDLSRDLAFLVNTLNLSQIIIGGDLGKYLDILEPTLKYEIQRNSSYKGYNSVSIKPSSKKVNSIAFGAASMIRENLFLTYENTSENPWTQKVGIELLNSFSTTIKNYKTTQN
ncbi:MAG: ROK family transcriptional regulator [Pleomorphochaeta sp.]